MSKTTNQGRKLRAVNPDRAVEPFAAPGGSEAELRAEIARLQSELKRASEPNRQIQRESKADLLLATSQKDVRYFVQFDWAPGEDAPVPDWTAELRNTSGVRIQVPVGLSHADALAAIDTLRKCVAENPDAFHCEVAPAAAFSEFGGMDADLPF